MSSKDRVPVVLSLIPSFGHPDFLRYRIADQFLRYWTGEGWTEPQDPTLARVYDDVNDAANEVHRILRLDYSDTILRRFVAPIYLELHSDSKVSREDVIVWLSKVSKLIMNTSKHGNGPMTGTLGLCGINWNLLEEIHETPSS